LTIRYFPPISDFANKPRHPALEIGNSTGIVAMVTDFPQCEK